MIGTIIGIEENEILLHLTIDMSKAQNLVNLYVTMTDPEKCIVGEITNIKDGIAYINMLGEMSDDKFVFGVVRKPSFSAKVELITDENQIVKIIGIEDYKENEHMYIGESTIYPGIEVGFKVNDFFANHFAIFGSTGSGKSCSVARIFQNLFEKTKSIPYKASIFIFDAYGEYRTAFEKLGDKVPQISLKTYTTNTELDDTEVVKIPLWLLGVDDIALLLGAEKAGQIPIIEKAMKLVTIFGREEELVIKHKNDIIARALLDILSSGRPSTQIRDQIMSVLTSFNTSELNLETEIFQPGYVRPLKQCLLIDASGKMREMELLVNFISTFLDDTLELKMPDGSFPYTLRDLKDAFEFALISEGALKNEKVYDEANVLKVRLATLINGDYSVYFDCNEYITKDEYIRGLMTQADGRKAQIINFNINYVDDRFAKVMVKIFSKLIFDYAKNLPQRASFPFHIVLEEAHRYVQNDGDVELLGYNIFERITKEGRKYGVILGLISQRPSDLSETSLSQCNNFLIFKMLHPKDVSYIREMVPNITNEIIKQLRILQPGTCIAFGNAFKIPLMVRLPMPNPSPSSSSCDVSSIWFVDKK